MPEVEEKFIQTSEGILSNLENNQTFSRNADSTSLREKILNPDFLEAEKFIDSLWLSEEDTTVLKHYNIHKNQQPLIGVPVLSGEEAIQELEELKKKHIQSLFSSRSPMLPSYYNRNAAVNYARRWALNPNPRYPYYTQNGDCTNFVSQALRAGGLRDFMDAEIGRNIGFLILKMTLACLGPMPIVSQDMFAKTLIDIPFNTAYPH